MRGTTRGVRGDGQPCSESSGVARTQKLARQTKAQLNRNFSWTLTLKNVDFN